MIWGSSKETKLKSQDRDISLSQRYIGRIEMWYQNLQDILYILSHLLHINRKIACMCKYIVIYYVQYRLHIIYAYICMNGYNKLHMHIHHNLNFIYKLYCI